MIHYLSDCIEVFRSGNGRDYSAGQSRSRVSKQQSLIRILLAAHQQRLNTGILVSNLADEYWGAHRRRLKNLARRISGGQSMAASLEQSPGLLSESQVLAVQFGTQTGMLEESLKSLLNNPIEPNKRKKSVIDSMIYPCVVLFLIACVLMFLMYFIVPMIYKISEEFGLDMPASLDTLTGFVNWFVNYWYLPIGLLTLAVLLASTSAGRQKIHAIWTKFPGTSNSRSPEFLQLLAVSTEMGRPIPAALSSLGRYHYDPSTRQQLLMARNEVEQGEDVWNSLAATGLLTPGEASGLAMMDDARLRAWAMRQLSSKKRSVSSHHSQAFQTFVQPVLVLFLALIVAWVAIGFMQFLSNLTSNLAAIG